MRRRRTIADDCTRPPPLARDRIENLKAVGVNRLGRGRLLHLDRIKHPVLLDNQVDFPVLQKHLAVTTWTCRPVAHPSPGPHPCFGPPAGSADQPLSQCTLFILWQILIQIPNLPTPRVIAHCKDQMQGEGAGKSGVTHLEDLRPKDIATGCSDRHDEKYQCSAVFTSDTILDHCHHFRMVGQPSAAIQPKAARQSAGILAFRWLFNDASPVFPLRGCAEERSSKGRRRRRGEADRKGPRSTPRFR